MNNFQKLLHIFRSSALTLVFRWGRCVRGRLTLACCCTVASTLCSLGTTLVTKELIDSAVSARADGLWHFALLLALLMLSQRFLRVFSSVLQVGTSSRLQKTLQGELMNDLLTREYAGLKRYHSGELVSRVFSDMSVIKGGIVSLLPSLCSMVISFIGAIIILGSMNWKLVVALLLGSLVGAAVMLLFRAPMKERHKRMQQAESHLHASVQETLENLRLVKASLSEKRIMSRVTQDQETLEAEQRRQGFFSIGMHQCMGVMFDASWLLCMIWGCVCIFNGELTYGALAAMIQLIGRIQGPISSAAEIAGQVYGVIASAERLQELLVLPCEKDGAPVKSFSAIRLNDVSFAYEDGSEDVLRHVSCEIRQGDFVALTGISGGGKTSLFQLLLGIYAPVSGEISFDT